MACLRGLPPGWTPSKTLAPAAQDIRDDYDLDIDDVLVVEEVALLLRDVWWVAVSRAVQRALCSEHLAADF